MKTYTESQRFSNLTLFILLPICALMCGSTIWQVVLGHPFGPKPAPDSLQIFFTLFTILLTLAFYFVRLKTLITEDGIKYNFSVLLSYGDKISWAEISQIEFLQFPYLGEGIRWWFTRNATAYVTNGGGNMGIMIYRKDKGRNIFISTKQVDELRAFIKSNAPEGVEIVGD